MDLFVDIGIGLLHEHIRTRHRAFETYLRRHALRCRAGDRLRHLTGDAADGFQRCGRAQRDRVTRNAEGHQLRDEPGLSRAALAFDQTYAEVRADLKAITGSA